MAKNFNADFYVTCATVIPVLYLALAVQGRAYESLLKSALTAARRRRIKQEKRRIGLTAEALAVTAWAILAAGTVGELIAVSALYTRSDSPMGRKWVYTSVLILVLAVAAGPLLGIFRLGNAFKELERRPQRVASGEDEATEDHHGGAPQQADAPGRDAD